MKEKEVKEMDMRKKILQLILVNLPVRIVNINPHRETFVLELSGPGPATAGLKWSMRAEASIMEFYHRPPLGLGRLVEVIEVTTPGVGGLLHNGGAYREWIVWKNSPIAPWQWEGVVETSSEFSDEMGYPFHKGPISSEELLSRLRRYLDQEGYEIRLERREYGLVLKADCPPL